MTCPGSEPFQRWAFSRLANRRCGRVVMAAQDPVFGPYAEGLADALVQLRAEGLYDPVTGLANRLLLSERLDRAFVRARREAGFGFSLLSLAFAGETEPDDAMTMEAAARLSNALRETDTIARVETGFFVLLDGCNRLDDAQAVGEQLRLKLREISGSAPLAVDVGCAVADVGQDPATLIDVTESARKADAEAALRFAPQPFRGEDDGRPSIKRVEQALSRGEIVPYFQPIVDLRSFVVIGWEALARWEHPDRGVLLPASFLPQVDTGGLSRVLGQQMLLSACTYAASKVAPGAISINVAAEHLAHPEFVSDVEDVLDATGLRPDRLRLELTETAPLVGEMRDVAALSMHRLVKHGVSFDLDDFGTGSGAPDMLVHLPIAAVKLHEELVRRAVGTQSARIVLRALLDMAAALGVDAIAEGIEGDDELDLARQEKVARGQGYALGQPEVG